MQEPRAAPGGWSDNSSRPCRLPEGSLEVIVSTGRRKPGKGDSMPTAVAIDESEKLDTGLTIAVFVDPVESAKAAGLRYVTDDETGIRRQKRGKGFTFVDPQGRTVKDEKTLERIRKLAIPPAWTEVWICPRPNGHLQATGRDARGRKQYRYHADWR